MPHDAVDRADEIVARLGGALEVLHHGRVHDGHLAEVDLAGRPVDRDDVALGDHHAAGGGEAALAGVHLQLLGPAHARLAHPPRHHGGVGGLAAPAGQNAPGGDHPGQVVGVGLAADEDDVLALPGQLDGALGGEDDLADGGAGRGVHALGDLPLGGTRVEAGEHELGELVAGDPGDGLVHRDEALVDELSGDAERGRRRALADPRLQHPELAALDGELDVAQVAVVVLQHFHDPQQLVVRVPVDVLQLLQRDRVADPGHHVLALGVLQVVAVDALLSRAGVTGEGDAGAGVVAVVAEDHGHDVHGSAEVGGDALLAAVEDGARGVPRVEDGHDGQAHLLARVGREVLACLLADDPLVGLHQPLQLARVQVGVLAPALQRVERPFEQVAVDAEHGLAEHLDEPAVGVPGEAVVAAGLLGQPVDGLVVEPDVEHGLHHPRHGELRP